MQKYLSFIMYYGSALLLFPTAIYWKVVGEVGPAPGWSRNCVRTAAGELKKSSIVAFFDHISGRLAFFIHES